MGQHKHIELTAMPGPVNTEPRIIAYVGTATLCQLLDVSDGTIWEWVRRGLLPRPVRIGVTARWKWAEIERRLSQTGEEPVDDPILRASRGS